MRFNRQRVAVDLVLVGVDRAPGNDLRTASRVRLKHHAEAVVGAGRVQELSDVRVQVGGADENPVKANLVLVVGRLEDGIELRDAGTGNGQASVAAGALEDQRAGARISESTAGHYRQVRVGCHGGARSGTGYGTVDLAEDAIGQQGVGRVVLIRAVDLKSGDQLIGGGRDGAELRLIRGGNALEPGRAAYVSRSTTRRLRR